MTDQADREVESEQTDETPYERERDEEAERRREAAESLKRDPPRPADEI